MTEEIKKYLSDILIAIELIEDFISDIDDFKSYQPDFKTQSAVERQLMIIGEALNNIKKADEKLKINNEKQIIGFRNRLVHAYDNIDNSIVWAVLNLHLNNLKLDIKLLIKTP